MCIRDSFYRAEEVHEQQGVGIGLYLAREIVTRHGGYIKVVSEPGKGSESVSYTHLDVYKRQVIDEH